MKYVGGKEKTIKWSSSAYKDQSFKYLDLEGILHVDLLPLVKRDYKFSNYKLKTVSEFFLGDTKDPLSVKGIFKCYRLGMAGAKKGASEEVRKKGSLALGVCSRYCVQDSALVLKLFDMLQTWVGLAEMAKVCNVPMFYLYTKGQQIKVYSQVYKKCMFEDRVVQRDGYLPTADERYTGAHVFDPKPGVYDRVVPFDFSSLYPTTIIAYNIDYSTLVPDESKIPDSDCNVIEWTDHKYCEHDKSVRKVKPKASEIICGVHHRYRFIKKPQGVMPSLLESLLSARTNTKGEIKDLKNEFKSWTKEKQESAEGRALQKTITVLDKRQLAFKVSSNSMYGALGVRRGYLPMLPAAMATTAWGRESLLRAAEALQHDHHGTLVYGDSVTGDTPVLIRVNGKEKYLRIDQVVLEDNLTSYRRHKAMSEPINIEVWSDLGWTKVKKVIRHRTEKKLYEVLCRTGVVTVTADHSLLNTLGVCIPGGTVKVGDELLTRGLPEPEEERFIFRGFEVSEALVFAMGAFYGHGGSHVFASFGRYESYDIVDTWKKLSCNGIPDAILVAPRIIRQCFFDGYCQHNSTSYTDTYIFYCEGKIEAAKDVSFDYVVRIFGEY